MVTIALRNKALSPVRLALKVTLFHFLSPPRGGTGFSNTFSATALYRGVSLFLGSNN